MANTETAVLNRWMASHALSCLRALLLMRALPSWPLFAPLSADGEWKVFSVEFMPVDDVADNESRIQAAMGSLADALLAYGVTAFALLPSKVPGAEVYVVTLEPVDHVAAQVDHGLALRLVGQYDRQYDDTRWRFDVLAGREAST